ncbi:glutamate racemase [Halobacteroides halobius DSM 5150]|uniref:Glutamate racemase n=1 Tax=Halobacteroides halobius (strain ATCC 35273 / DSM 5150 / MD-1) TaxID=748449 RepID=L0K7F2_HALHC|nr:glutamate racemase [Halobacteroides halobius]AGB40470.1 glutamate racemase [Halobacteroides halobius DSM 5150]
MEQDKPIVLFDSGVGGLTIAKEIINQFPQEKIIYFGDTAHLPYGEREQEEVEEFVLKIIDYFVNLGAKMVIIACNTATAAGLELARDNFSLPIIGPIDAGVEKAIAGTKNKKIGVIATEGTVDSGAYQEAIKQANSEVEVFVQACPKFVPLVEAGELYSQQVREIAQDYLAPLQEEEVDTLLLGCTHFPYLSKIIKEIMGQEVTLIYPGQSIALKAREILVDKDLMVSSSSGEAKFYVSDLDKLSKKFVKIGAKFLNFDQLNFSELDLWEK